MTPIRLRLPRGYETIIDTEDYSLVSKYKWYPHIHHGMVYAVSSNSLRMHRLIMNAPPDKQVDHINRNGLDNRKQNLRLCSNAENIRNSKKQNGKCSSKFKGVSKARKGKYIYWVGKVQSSGKVLWRRYFKNEIEAAKGYDFKARELFGEFARTNFPLEMSKDYDDSTRKKILNNETVKKIRSEYELSDTNRLNYGVRKRLALKYGIHPNTIDKIARGITHALSLR